MKQLLLIPGPTLVSDEVLEALSQETMAHTDERFVKITSETLVKVKVLFGADKGHPFVIAGSGTLGMEMSLTNILDDKENLLVISHGYFGDRFIDIGHALNVNVDVLRAPTGETVPIETIERTVKDKHFDALTITHADTSTGTLSDVEAIAKAVHSISPSTLIVVDGVCATGGVKELFDDWGIDVFFTCSQKAVCSTTWVNNVCLFRTSDCQEKVNEDNSYLLRRYSALDARDGGPSQVLCNTSSQYGLCTE